MVDSVCIGCGRDITEIKQAYALYAQRKKAASSKLMICYACRGVTDVGCQICEGRGRIERS